MTARSLALLFVAASSVLPAWPRRPQAASESRSNSPILNMSRSIGRTSTAGPPTITPPLLRFFSRVAAHSRQQSAGQRRGCRDHVTALKSVCARALAAVPLEEEGARKFFEDNFRPLRISKLGDSDGFLTGYYEPIIEGSRVPTGEFIAPLYRRPPNLVVSGRRKARRCVSQQGRQGWPPRRPAQNRALLRPRQIEDGALDGWHLEICWLRSQIDVLFAQIQGSARIKLEDGTILRVNYNSHNGWPYTPVGRVLIERKFFTKDEVSMQRIRDWMQANPDAGQDVRRHEQVVRILPHHRAGHGRRGGRCSGRTARAGPLDCGRSCSSRLRHAIFHLGGSSDRQ